MEPERVAEAWIAAFNGRDLDTLLGLYHPEAIHHSPKLREKRPETEGAVRGKEALRDWWTDAFAGLPSLHYDLERITANESCVLMEYMRRVDGEQEMRVAEVLQVRDGLIVESRVYHG